MRTLSFNYRHLKKIMGISLLLGSPCLQAEQISINDGTIDINIDTEYQPDSLLIIVDAQDITAFATPDEKGISIILPPLPKTEKHNLLLSFTTSEGYDVSRRIELISGQESYYNSTSGVGITLRAKVHDENDINEQDLEVDAHFGHLAAWGSGAWSGDVSGDVWVFDRGTDISPIEDGRAELTNYYASARHQNDNRNVLVEAGYIQLDESKNTISQLARRGAQASIRNEKLSLGIFSVNSQQHLGSEGGAGLGDGSDDTITGLSAGWTPVSSRNQTLKLQAIYSNGSENGDSLGILSNNTASEGDVAGLLVESTFNQLGLTLEAEFDRSSYDADTSDTTKAIDDDAYALRLKGQSEGVSYRAAYEHIGTNYAVVANPLLQNDREYITLGLDFDRGEHGFALNAQAEHDNLDKETTRSQLNKTYLSADYRFRKGRNFATFISLQNNQIESSDEPAITDTREIETNSVLGRVRYASANWNHQFSLLLSGLTDEIDSNNDSDIVSFSFSPAFSTQLLYFTPSFSITETEFDSGHKTRQGVVSLYLQGKAFNGKLDYQLSTSVSELTDNTASDIDATTLIARTEWTLGDISTNFEKPHHSIGLELELYDTEDTASGTQEDSLIWLIYRVDIGFRS